MAEARTVARPGHYWDVTECAWVRCPQPVDVPAQAEPVAVETTVEAAAEADVRSG